MNWATQELTYCGLNKLAVILQTIVKCIFWQEVYVFWFKFHWVYSSKCNWQLVSINSRNGLVWNRLWVITWSNDDAVQHHHNSSLGHNELKEALVVPCSPTPTDLLSPALPPHSSQESCSLVARRPGWQGGWQQLILYRDKALGYKPYSQQHLLLKSHQTAYIMKR